jgi:hypothetical protein
LGPKQPNFRQKAQLELSFWASTFLEMNEKRHFAQQRPKFELKKSQKAE